MKTYTIERGFRGVEHEAYSQYPEPKRILQESSAIGPYEDSVLKPGSSFLWIGEHHHINREEVKELISYMQFWLDKKRLKEDGEL